MAAPPEASNTDFQNVVQEMTRSITNTRSAIQSLVNDSDIDIKDGISLLSLKHQLVLSYAQSLTLLAAHRLVGHSLKSRTRPPEPFMASQRSVRGSEGGDLVDTVIEDRLVLDKVKQLESKMRYQIEKLVRLAEEDAAKADIDVVNAFRPNPENLADNAQSDSEDEDEKVEEADRGGVYRPPKLAPMPYTETKTKTKRKAAVPAGLAALAHLDGHNPHAESTSGLGAAPSMASSRAKELASITQYEEENMTRLMMTKKESRRRIRDEADIALGGTGLSKGRRRGAGLEDEFGDILRAVDRGRDLKEDGYEALRAKGKKQDAFTRSRGRERDTDDEGGRPKKKGRFQTAVKLMAKKKQRS
ncbi:hypothetical protein M422DRAFT_47316 [Sphaerobolus stellatus SS14]|uniref:Neuroguidin n=1 Tax=Sphaerobolus stellatus (strain SS14) TaxID=990650 RepID=A0A0C9VPS5_SPHS4|nr:hypothetical protein M422DRAFT_47316 [Sphaerobolus stellatus SS14]